MKNLMLCNIFTELAGFPGFEMRLPSPGRKATQKSHFPA
jgi:hypothetical protein